MTQELIPISRPSLGEEEALAAREAILSGWVTQGPRVLAFEEAFRELTASPHACAVSSGTTAIQLALIAVGVVPGDVVIAPSHSFIATANAVRHCGAEPVFVDVDARTLNVAAAALAALLEADFEQTAGGPRYRRVHELDHPGSPLNGIEPARRGRLGAILVAHQLGMPADMAALLSVAEPLRVPVVEDAACAIGSEIAGDPGWRPVGRPLGAAATFSFHPRKVLTTGEGGMVTTRDPAVDHRVRLLRNHGASAAAHVRHGTNRPAPVSYLETGFNFRMSDIQAAIGIEQLKRLPGLIRERRAIAAYYTQAIARTGRAEVQVESPHCRSNWQSFYVALRAGLRADRVIEAMRARNVSCQTGVMCAHREAPYIPVAREGWKLPGSEAAQDRGVLLPMFNGLSEADQRRVMLAFEQAVEG